MNIQELNKYRDEIKEINAYFNDEMMRYSNILPALILRDSIDSLNENLEAILYEIKYK